MSESEGGSGGTYNRHQPKDLKLFRLALSQRFPLSQEMKATMLRRVSETLADPKAHPRSVIAAGRLLVSASQANLASIDTALRCRHQEELEGRFRELEAYVNELLSDESQGRGPQGEDRQRFGARRDRLGDAGVDAKDGGEI
jgi:hypothetical protein